MDRIPRTGRVRMSAALLTLLAIVGCSPAPDMRDQRLAEFAKQSVAQQAQQNDHLARQSQAVVEQSQKLAEAGRELVAQDAAARREMVSAQQGLNAQLNQQRATIDAGRDDLEQERRQIAEQRHRDPIVSASIQTAGLLLACLLPLLVCVFIIRQMGRHEPEDAAVAELLVCELTSDQPRLLPGPAWRPALEHRPSHEMPLDSPPDGCERSC